VADLFDPPREVVMTRSAWDDALERYYAEHDEIGTDADARGPSYLRVEKGGDVWLVRQTLADPEDHRDWVIEAEVDVVASDALGEAVVTTTAMRRVDGI